MVITVKHTAGVTRKQELTLRLTSWLCAIPICCAASYAASLATRDTTIQLLPEPAAPILSHFGLWQNIAPEELISFAEVNGRRIPLTWRRNSQAGSANAREVTFVYETTEPHLRLRWTWTARAATGPLEHTTYIDNLDSREVWVPLQNSLTFSLPINEASKFEHVYIDKGAGKPSGIGTHENDMPAGYRWNGASSTYAQLFHDEPREVIPWFAIQNNSAGWYVGIEFSGRTRLRCERTAQSISGSVGLDPQPGSAFRTRLTPGSVFATPTIFLGAYRNNLDEMGNTLRPWIRAVLGNGQAWNDPAYPLLVNNSWGSGMQVDERLAQNMIRDSAELGLEMFHLDAGWFRAVGDWHPDPNKFPHGLAPIADLAHRAGLRFGMWVDWTQAGLAKYPGALYVRDPAVNGWLVSDVPANWRPQEFKGITVDIGLPAAQQYAEREVDRLVNDYRLDMLEHDGYVVAQGCIRRDHPHAPPDLANLHLISRDGNSAVESSNSTDVSYHAVLAYYAVQDKLHRRHPHLLLEICNDGGRMVDFGAAAHGDYFSITDTYDPLSNRRAFYDASYLLPTAMLESYVEKWRTPRIENFRYLLRSGMLGWLTLMLDTTNWNAAEHATAKADIQTYKQQLRPLIRDAALYHVSSRPDGIGWDGIEYFDAQRQKGVVYAFHGSDTRQTEHTFRLRGIAAGQRYRLHFQDGSSPDATVSGAQLLNSGLHVTLPVPLSSELIFLEAAMVH